MSALPAEAFIVEVEQEVLGAIMMGSDLRRIHFLQPEHFREPLHQFLFANMRTAFERYGSVNPVIVYKLIPVEDAKTLGAKIGKSIPAYLASLAANTVYGPAKLEQSARKVVEQWGRLSLADEAQRLFAAASDPSSNPVELISVAGQAFDDVLSSVRSGPKRKTRLTVAEAVENAVFASRDAAQRGNGLTGITWGLSDVNRVTGGMQRRDLTLLAARPSMGKTTVGLSAALSAAKSGRGVGFISLEMDADKLGARAITDLAYDWGVRVAYADVIKGKADAGALDSLQQAARDLDKLPLWIEDQSGLSMTDIRIKAEAMMAAAEKNGTPLEVLFIDHLGLIKPSSRYQGNRVNEVTEMSGALKSLAREYGIAVIALSQLNRALEGRNDKRPQLSDLRDSGSLEQDADTIVFLYREAYYLEREKGAGAEAEAERIERLVDCQGKLEFHIAKQRNGPITCIDLYCDIACSAVRNGMRP